MPDTKRILIVDDSEIDRSILKNILCRYFEVVEADNGYSALEIITKRNPKVDGILLDISMPFLDGFNVLEIMAEKKIRIPVVLVTVEATIENVEHAAKFEITDFIRKPFDTKVILEKMEHIFGIDCMISAVKSHETNTLGAEADDPDAYIAKLTFIYREFLKNIGMDDKHYHNVSMLMQILLSEYAASTKTELGPDEIKVISKAAYFHDIGLMGVPTELIFKEHKTYEDHEIYNSHTVIGASIVSLNRCGKCEFFAEVCSDLCLHHHARNDGSGFPFGMASSEHSVYSQLCGLSIRFDRLFCKRKDINAAQFDFVINELRVDKGAFSSEMMTLLSSCRSEVLRYYKKIESEELVPV